MKVHILNYEPNRIGGGWTAAKYLAEGLNHCGYEEADAILITGPTMASHEQVEQAKRDGKKIVLRIDNAVRDSRNRGTGMSRMKAFYDVADLVVFQSKWARDFLEPFLSTDGQSLIKNAVVIINGVDTHKFKPVDNRPDDSYLYIRSSRDEGKGWINAWYWFANNPGTLEIVGKFSSENLEYGFDFFNDEQYRFMGEQPSENMPDVFRRNKYFLYSYWCEAGSNTLLEARASGCEIIDVMGALKTGCGPEYMACRDISVERMIEEYRTCLAAIA